MLAVTIVFLLLVTTEHDQFALPVGTPYEADVVRKCILYNPHADVVPQYDIALLRVEIEPVFVQQDSTVAGRIVSMTFIKIPESRYTPRQRLELKPAPLVGGYIGETVRRYERHRKEEAQK